MEMEKYENYRKKLKLYITHKNTQLFLLKIPRPLISFSQLSRKKKTFSFFLFIKKQKITYRVTQKQTTLEIFAGVVT